MNKKLSKVLAVGLSVLTVASTAVPAFAATNYKDSTASIVEDINGGDVVGKDENQSATSKYAEYSDDTAASTDVYVSQKSTFSVVAPVVAVLNGKAGEVNSGDVRYKVFGNIAADEKIVVEPDTSFALHQDGKKDITCTIEGKGGIPQTEFTYLDGVRPDEADALTQDYTITAQNLTAGSWSGSFNTNISLEQSPLPGYTTLYEYDLSATENDNVKAYYMVPNENTSPIEVQTTSDDSSVTANANLLSSVTNMLKPMTAYAADENYIEYNGIRYELSDEDTLVITGSGEMKENIQADLVDYKGIQDAVYEHFPNLTRGTIAPLDYDSVSASYGKVSPWRIYDDSKDVKYICDFATYKNQLYPLYFAEATSEQKEYSGFGENYKYVEAKYLGEYNTYINNSFCSEVVSYIDSIKTQYAVSFPKIIEIRDGVTNISEQAFQDCTSLASVTIPQSVTSIGAVAFDNCKNLTDVTIGEGVTSIGQAAFNGCTNLKSITIPESVKSIGSMAFQGCYNLEKVNISSIGAWCDIDFKDVNSKSNPLSQAKGLYLNNELITDLTIPNGVTTIKKEAFRGCTSLTSITIPDSVTSINNYAFRSCTGLKNVTIPNSVTSIGQYAFAGTNLTSIIIPDGVTSIAWNVFENCTNLTDVTIGKDVTSIGGSAFSRCENLTSVTIPNKVTLINDAAFQNCSSLKTVYIPSSVTQINSNAFKGLASNSTIYCETQAVANLLVSDKKYDASNTTVVVDATKF